VSTFRNKICFYGEQLSASRPTPKLEDHSLSAVRDCLFSIFAATIHIGGRSAVVTGTHLSRLPPAYFPTFLSSLSTILFAGMLVLFFASNKRLGLSETTYRTLMEYISWQTGTSLKQPHPYQPWGIHSAASA
jgi:hypothetical protein